MAEAIARDMIEKRGWTGVEVRSAGVGAFPGAPASGGALRVTAARGLDLDDHRATLLTPAEVARADLILTMSPSHLARVNDFGGGPRATLLTTYAEGRSAGGGSVPDPIGGSDREYEQTCSRLEELVGKVIARLAPEVGA
jgi:protein-tyrosine phosphatase